MTDTRSTPDSTLDRMRELTDGFLISQALYVVTETGVATILEQEGPTPVGELAERTGTRRDALHRLIRALAPHGVFTTDGDLVDVTPLGATLSQTHPRSLYYMTRMAMETCYLPLSQLGHSVRTGRPAAEEYLRVPFFDWLGQDPLRAELFGLAMAEITSTLRTGMFDDYRLPPGRVVADIGGSDGSVLVELLRHDGDPERRGIVFDRPIAVTTAEATLAGAGLTGRVDRIAGDFFVEVPAADVYVLGHILHDWDDEHCRRILGSIATAGAPGTRLLVVEGVVPDGDGPHFTKSLDLVMLGTLTGRERTEREYRDLLDGAGFTLDRVVPTPTPYVIMEATLR